MIVTIYFTTMTETTVKEQHKLVYQAESFPHALEQFGQQMENQHPDEEISDLRYKIEK